MCRASTQQNQNLDELREGLITELACAGIAGQQQAQRRSAGGSSGGHDDAAVSASTVDEHAHERLSICSLRSTSAVAAQGPQAII